MLRLVAIVTFALAGAACGGKTSAPAATPPAPTTDACGGCPDGQRCDTCPGDPTCPTCDVCGPAVCVAQ